MKVNMKPHQQFRRHAESYERYNLIQTRVARALVSALPLQPERVVDLGCGSGTMYRAFGRRFSSYLAIDAAEEMLARHPRDPGIVRMQGNFDDPALFEKLSACSFDLLVSSSALQWARDLDWTLAQIAALQKPVALTLFTAGTFGTLHRIAGVPSPIRDTRTTEKLLRRHLSVRIDRLEYRLYFRDTLAMVRYIKRSGVSGGKRHLAYRELKALLASYPLSYLEFEVLRAVSV